MKISEDFWNLLEKAKAGFSVSKIRFRDVSACSESIFGKIATKESMLRMNRLQRLDCMV